MHRPVMNPSFLDDVEPDPAPRPRRRRTRALVRAVAAAGRLLLHDPFDRRAAGPRLRVDDGSTPLTRFVRGLVYRLTFVPVVGVAFLVSLVFGVTHPPRDSAPPGDNPVAYGVYYDPVDFLGRDGSRLDAWVVPVVDARRVVAEGEAALRRSPAVVLVHDFASGRHELLPLVRPLHDAGFEVLVVNLRGAAPATPGARTFGIREADDVAGAVYLLRRRPCVNPEQIAIVGNGTGATAAMLAARNDPAVAALVLDHPADSFDAAFAARVGPDRAWARALRPLLRWTFNVMYNLDAEDVARAPRDPRLRDRPTLTLGAPGSPPAPMTPATIDEVCRFLQARLNTPESDTATIVRGD